MKRLTSIGRCIWWWRFVWIRLEKVFERHRPIQCNWHIRLVNWVAFMLQSIVRLGHAMATNSHCTQRCFHFISYVVCLVVFFIYSFSLVFRFIRFYFIFFCAFSFRHLWFIPLSIVFDQLECVERGGGETQHKVWLTTRANASENMVLPCHVCWFRLLCGQMTERRWLIWPYLYWSVYFQISI